jgi:hypothetical protein
MDRREPSCHPAGVRRRLSSSLGTLTYLACLCIGGYVFNIGAPKNASTAWIVASLALVAATLLVSFIVHELGHALAVRLTGQHVTAIYFFAPPALVTFHVGALPVGLGCRLRGRVTYDGSGRSALRDAVITAAGPAANLLSAPLFFLLPLPRWITAYLALITLASGLQDLAPATGRGDVRSDGSKLLRMPARQRASADIAELLDTPDWSARPDAADGLVRAYCLDVPEASECLLGPASRPDVLLDLYRQDWTLPDHPSADAIRAIHHLSWKLVSTAGLATELADLAASRIEWVLGQLDRDKENPVVKPYNARHTLAVARLRQGRPADVRRLCADALAADLTPADRATVLATVAMARDALLLSGHQAVDEALALDPDADLVGEAVAVLGNRTPSTRRPPGPPRARCLGRGA